VKKILGLLMLCFSMGVLAKEFEPLQLDTVSFQMVARQWVVTQSVLLSVTINASLNTNDLPKIRSEMLANLNKIARGDWQLVQFERTKDSSGLEKLYVQAQVRIAQNETTNAYQNAKNVSKPGATYEILEIAFKPSMEEVQQAKTELRNKLYQQVLDELNRINKVYSSQKYSLNKLIFSEGDLPGPQIKMMQMREMSDNAVSTAAAAPSLPVSNEILLTAFVEVASNRSNLETA
jgi:hypothetical protein